MIATHTRCKHQAPKVASKSIGWKRDKEPAKCNKEETRLKLAGSERIELFTSIPLFRYQFRRLMWVHCPLKVKWQSGKPEADEP